MRVSGKKYTLAAGTLFLLLVLLIISKSCLFFEPEQLVIVETGPVSEIGYYTCAAKGEIYDVGEDHISQHGFCWSTSENPTVENSEKNQLGSSINTGSFTSILMGLSANTSYYIRAYGINDAMTVYGKEHVFKTLAPNSVNDFDGNIYQTVVIGNQTWMAENMKVKHYADGTPIPLVEEKSSWEALDYNDKAYCYYDNSSDNNDIYGALYNWAAASNGESSSGNPSVVQGVCPEGWHLPSDEEWKELEKYLGMNQTEADGSGYRGTDEGGKLKEFGTVHWSDPNTGASNESGFTALPGGYRYYASSYCLGIFECAYFWTATEKSDSTAWFRMLDRESEQVYRVMFDKSEGYSVRCAKD